MRREMLLLDLMRNECYGYHVRMGTRLRKQRLGYSHIEGDRHVREANIRQKIAEETRFRSFFFLLLLRLVLIV